MPRSRPCGRRLTKWTVHCAGTPQRRLGIAESALRFFCSAYAGRIAGVRVNEDSFIVITADVPRVEPVAVTIAVGPDGTCACNVSTANADRAATSPDPRSFERLLTSRLSEVGVSGDAGTGRG